MTNAELRTNTIQMQPFAGALRNGYMQRHQFLCNKKMSKNRKIDENSNIKSLLSFERSEFRKEMTYNNTKSHKKPGLHPRSRKNIWKNHRWGSN